MKERPILFSAPMVRALLDGTKTQTRRLVRLPKGTADEWRAVDSEHVPEPGIWHAPTGHTLLCPYGERGDRLWVRETLKIAGDGSWHYAADWAPVQLDEDDPRVPQMISWAHHTERDTCVSIHMPRFASRITREITRVRVERLQDITEADARAEGFVAGPIPARINGEPGRVCFFDPRQWFASVWNAINGKRAPWESNPWVWVVEFQRERIPAF